MNKSIVIIDKVFAALFAALGLAAAYGVVIKGAWWHIVTAAICTLLVFALLNDAKKETKTVIHNQ